MNKLRLSAAIAALGFSSAAVAVPEVPLEGQPFYWGVSYAWASFTQDGLGDEANPGVLVGRFGYHFHDMVSAEVRYGRGVRDDDIGGVSVDVDHLYGIYGKVNLLTDIDFTPYAILGYSEGEASTAAGSTKDNGVSYGLGVDFCSDQPVCLNTEYMWYLSEDLFDATAFSVGLRINF